MGPVYPPMSMHMPMHMGKDNTALYLIVGIVIIGIIVGVVLFLNDKDKYCSGNDDSSDNVICPSDKMYTENSNIIKSNLVSQCCVDKAYCSGNEDSNLDITCPTGMYLTTTTDGEYMLGNSISSCCTSVKCTGNVDESYNVVCPNGYGLIQGAEELDNVVHHLRHDICCSPLSCVDSRRIDPICDPIYTLLDDPPLTVDNKQTIDDCCKLQCKNYPCHEKGTGHDPLVFKDNYKELEISDLSYLDFIDGDGTGEHEITHTCCTALPEGSATCKSEMDRSGLSCGDNKSLIRNYESIVIPTTEPPSGDTWLDTCCDFVPKDCIGEWEQECNAPACDDTSIYKEGTIVEKYKITRESAHGGEDCPYEEGLENELTTTCTELCPIDCEVHWLPWSLEIGTVAPRCEPGFMGVIPATCLPESESTIPTPPCEGRILNVDPGSNEWEREQQCLGSDTGCIYTPGMTVDDIGGCIEKRVPPGSESTPYQILQNPLNGGRPCPDITDYNSKRPCPIKVVEKNIDIKNGDLRTNSGQPEDAWPTIPIKGAELTWKIDELGAATELPINADGDEDPGPGPGPPLGSCDFSEGSTPQEEAQAIEVSSGAITCSNCAPCDGIFRSIGSGPCSNEARGQPATLRSIDLSEDENGLIGRVQRGERGAICENLCKNREDCIGFDYDPVNLDDERQDVEGRELCKLYTGSIGDITNIDTTRSSCNPGTSCGDNQWVYAEEAVRMCKAKERACCERNCTDDCTGSWSTWSPCPTSKYQADCVQEKSDGTKCLDPRPHCAVNPLTSADTWNSKQSSYFTLRNPGKSGYDVDGNLQLTSQCSSDLTSSLNIQEGDEKVNIDAYIDSITSNEKWCTEDEGVPGSCGDGVQRKHKDELENQRAANPIILHPRLGSSISAPTEVGGDISGTAKGYGGCYSMTTEEKCIASASQRGVEAGQSPASWPFSISFAGSHTDGDEDEEDKWKYGLNNSLDIVENSKTVTYSTPEHSSINNICKWLGGGEGCVPNIHIRGTLRSASNAERRAAGGVAAMTLGDRPELAKKWHGRDRYRHGIHGGGDVILKKERSCPVPIDIATDYPTCPPPEAPVAQYIIDYDTRIEQGVARGEQETTTTGWGGEGSHPSAGSGNCHWWTSTCDYERVSGNGACNGAAFEASSDPHVGRTSAARVEAASWGGGGSASASTVGGLWGDTVNNPEDAVGYVENKMREALPDETPIDFELYTKWPPDDPFDDDDWLEDTYGLHGDGKTAHPFIESDLEGRLHTHRVGRTWSGSDSVNSHSISNCKAMCTQHPRCNSFTWDAEDDKCYFHAKKNPTTGDRPQNSSVPRSGRSSNWSDMDCYKAVTPLWQWQNVNGGAKTCNPCCGLGPKGHSPPVPLHPGTATTEEATEEHDTQSQKVWLLDSSNQFLPVQPEDGCICPPNTTFVQGPRDADPSYTASIFGPLSRLRADQWECQGNAPSEKVIGCRTQEYSNYDSDSTSDISCPGEAANNAYGTASAAAAREEAVDLWKRKGQQMAGQVLKWEDGDCPCSGFPLPPAPLPAAGASEGTGFCDEPPGSAYYATHGPHAQGNARLRRRRFRCPCDHNSDCASNICHEGACSTLMRTSSFTMGSAQAQNACNTECQHLRDGASETLAYSVCMDDCDD